MGKIDQPDRRTVDEDQGYKHQADQKIPTERVKLSAPILVNPSADPQRKYVRHAKNTFNRSVLPLDVQKSLPPPVPVKPAPMGWTTSPANDATPYNKSANVRKGWVRWAREKSLTS